MLPNEIIGSELSFTEAELKETLTPEYFVSIRTIYGGTAPSETKRALSVEKEAETTDEQWLNDASDALKNASENLKNIVTGKIS